MKVFQIRQDDRFAWYETDQEQMESMVNKCGWQGRVLELAKEDIPAQTGMIGITASELSAMINWLENGCDPKEAAKELRLYGERAWTGAMPAADDLPPLTMSVYGTRTELEAERERRNAVAQRTPNFPPLPTPAATEQKMYVDPVLWFTEDQMQGRYKRGRAEGIEEAARALVALGYGEGMATAILLTLNK